MPEGAWRHGFRAKVAGHRAIQRSPLGVLRPRPRSTLAAGFSPGWRLAAQASYPAHCRPGASRLQRQRRLARSWKQNSARLYVTRARQTRRFATYESGRTYGTDVPDPWRPRGRQYPGGDRRSDLDRLAMPGPGRSLRRPCTFFVACNAAALPRFTTVEERGRPVSFGLRQTGNRRALSTAQAMVCVAHGGVLPLAR
mgnify:CR=1 FL=1